MLADKLLKPPQTTPTYIEDVFSTYLYTGNSPSTQNIVNGVDLAGKGGMVWTAARSVADNKRIWDTARGANKDISTNSTAAQFTRTNALTSFNADGFSLGADSAGVVNATGSGAYASWTFRKQPKFFDVVTYTGNGTSQNIAHSLGSVPGCIIVKRTDAAKWWAVQHRSVPASQVLELDATIAAVTDNAFNSAYPTSTTFSVAGIDQNSSGATYVAYLFAHDAGGFGLTGTDNVISCGSIALDGTNYSTVNLGWEPQWVLIKNSTSTSSGAWEICDSMRGMPATSGENYLLANTSAAEGTGGYNLVRPTSTGFSANSSAGTYIYIAIRRGPMKVPTDGTKVFKPNTVSSDASAQTTNFPVDMFLTNNRAGNALNTIAVSKLTSNSGLVTSSTAAEAANYASSTWWQSNTSYTAGVWGTASIVDYAFQRAPSFFDVVCYTGTGVARNINHNLGVAPEMIIGKPRSLVANWEVYQKDLGDYVTDRPRGLLLNTNGAVYSAGQYRSSGMTSTTFGVGAGEMNQSGITEVCYLFATCAGVSKVGSYTGNGSSQTINCGFAGGARFVLIKRTDSTGDWYVYDTARGMTTLTDPYLLLNSTAAESATLGSVTTVTTGFAVNASILAAINTNAASYIYLAIA